MRSKGVEWFSGAVRLRGILRLPEEMPAGRGYPALVHGPGFRGVAAQQNYIPWHEAFTAAGYAVLALDYRGYGESDGERGWLRPDWQVEDILSAITYLTSHPEVDAQRIGAYGMGGTGGGNAVMAAALDVRVRCVCAQTAVADGTAWMHRLRHEGDWLELLQHLAEDDRRWVMEGTGEQIDSDLLMTPYSPGGPAHGTATGRGPVYLRTIQHVLRYEPIRMVDRISPRALLLTCLENDPIIPEDTVVAMYERAGRPRKLIRQYGISHYDTYSKNFPALSEHFIDWYDRFLKRDRSAITQADMCDEVVNLGPG